MAIAKPHRLKHAEKMNGLESAIDVVSSEWYCSRIQTQTLDRLYLCLILKKLKPKLQSQILKCVSVGQCRYVLMSTSGWKHLQHTHTHKHIFMYSHGIAVYWVQCWFCVPLFFAEHFQRMIFYFRAVQMRKIIFFSFEHMYINNENVRKITWTYWKHTKLVCNYGASFATVD